MKKELLSIMLMALAIAIPTKTWAQNFIQFEDDVVKSICVTNWDTNGDGELSFDEAAAVTDIGKVFKQQYFTRFNELEYFTNLTAIPDSAFCFCSLLEEIRLPQGITSIGNTAFAYNDSLRFVELRDGLESIGQEAFSYCESLFEIYIPSTVTSIGAIAFSRCQNVEYVFVDERNTVYDSRNDCNAIIETATNTLIFGFKSSQIPESVVTIGNMAFYGCQFQTVPTFPSSLRSIGEDAFYDCQGLNRLVLPEGLERISSYAFRSCDIEELTLPSTLTTIGQDCFEFNNIHSLKIPASLTSIGMGAFSSNTELSEIVVEEGNPIYSSPNNCNAIYETSRGRIQQGCNTTVFPEGTKILGWSSFQGMKQITTMIIPEGVVDLGDYTFYYCDGIRELSIPSTVGRDGFGEVTFEDCTGLETIRCYIKQPSALPSKYSGPFGCNRDRYYIYEHATLYVPYGTKALYESTDGWNRFKNIVEMEKVDEPEVKAEFGERMLTLWRQVDGKEYRLYKAVDKSQYRTNSDGWNMYLTQLTLDIVNGNDTTKVMVDEGTLYTDESYFNNGFTPCMMIDKERNMMYVFSNSKTEGGGYTMNGYAYLSSIDQPAFRKETVFEYGDDYTNWGWYPIFTGTTDDGQPILSHFSYAGYYDMISRRVEEGRWYSEYIGDMEPDASNRRWENINKVTVIGDTSADELNLDGVVYTLRRNHQAALSWVNDRTQLENIDLPTQITLDNTNWTVTAIAPFALYECYNLRELNIPESISQIEEAALLRCNSLSNIYLNNENPPIMKTKNEELIQYGRTGLCLLHTPSNYASRYKNAQGWNAYANVTDGLTTWVNSNDILRNAMTEETAQTLASIVWNGTTELNAEMLQRINNPNLLVYVNEPSLAPQGVQNVVVNGQAQEIVLTDAKEGNNNWYCPQTFTAEKISYTRNFGQQTEVGVSRGWESIALPFTVQEITHESKGQITPFGTNGTKHFWLRGYSPNGLHSTTTMEAYKPYVISMPNNTVIYPDAYNLNGRVTFSAENTTVPATPDPYDMIVTRGDITMIPAFQSVEKNEVVYAINVGQALDRYAEGSVFARDLREVRPFEAVTVHEPINGARPNYIRVAAQPSNESVGIRDIDNDSSVGAWYSVDGRQLQGEPKTKGVYIQKGKKIIK